MLDTQIAPDPTSAPAAAPEPQRSRRGTFRKWRARFLVLVMIAGAVYAGYVITRSKAGNAAEIDLGTVTLTSQVVPVETPRPGQVMSVDVEAADRVEAGQQLGSVQVTTTDSDGLPVLSTITLVAPRTGIVVDDPVTVGSTLQPGRPFVELYDPTQLTFEGRVSLTELRELSLGMIATLTAQNMRGSISATVQRAVPLVGDKETSKPDTLRIVLAPMNEAEVARLVPGLRFTATVDTGTGPADRPKLVYVGA